jgi:hypothetical protein
LRKAIATDAAETAEHGDRRGDELPEILATAQGRRGWLRAAAQRLEQQRADEARPIRRSRGARLVEGKRRLEQELAVERAASDRYEHYRARGVMKDERRFGGPPQAVCAADTPRGRVNLTDPDSKLVHGMRAGFRATTRRLSATSST